MFKNNLKIALRTLWKDKFYSIISVFGLAISIAFCLLMMVYLRNESTYDQHHKDAHNVYRVVFDNYEDMGPYATTPLPVGPALKADFPEVEAMTRITHAFQSLMRFNNNQFFETLSFVDSGLVDVLNMEFIYGDPKTVLEQPNQIMLSESTAKKYFGNANPVGQLLKIGSSGNLNSVVGAVFKDFPQNTHINLEIGLPFASFMKIGGQEDLWKQMPRSYTYVRLVEGQKGIDFLNKLPAFAQRHVGEAIPDWEQAYQLNIQPIESIYLQSKLQRETAASGDISSLYLLGFIALLVLLIAGINYVNYATARFSKRAKEVGVRKVLGARRLQLIKQFLLETFLIALIAGSSAYLLAELFLPTFNTIAGKYFVASDLNHQLVFTSLGGLILLIAFGAGLFPALFLSGFRPVEVLKGKFSNLSLPNISRKYLVVTQFTASIILLIATMVVYNQMQFARGQFQSKSEEKIVLFQVNDKLNEKYEVLKENLLGIPGIEQVTAGSNMPTFYGDSWPVRRDLDADIVQTENYVIENGFIETLDYELIAGRDLDKNRAEDVKGSYIVNETAVKLLGFDNPEAALGQTIYWGSDELSKKGNIVGVIKDFHFESLHHKIEPALLQFAPTTWLTNNFVAAKIKASQYANIQPAIQKTVAELDPNWLADVQFLDANFEKVHRKDIQQGQIFGAFALLAIIISCLGLLGLVAFSAERRTKEIGVRKILGASVSSIIALLSKEFLTLILIALLIAIPSAWFLMKSWLTNFVYHINIEWWVFALAGVTTIGIALLTISFQSVKAALANPVKSLRNE